MREEAKPQWSPIGGEVAELLEGNPGESGEDAKDKHFARADKPVHSREKEEEGQESDAPILPHGEKTELVKAHHQIDKRQHPIGKGPPGIKPLDSLGLPEIERLEWAPSAMVKIGYLEDHLDISPPGRERDDPWIIPRDGILPGLAYAAVGGYKRAIQVEGVGRGLVGRKEAVHLSRLQARDAHAVRGAAHWVSFPGLG